MRVGVGEGDRGTHGAPGCRAWSCVHTSVGTEKACQRVPGWNGVKLLV